LAIDRILCIRRFQMSTRSKLIRLAHERPDLRAQIVPLLRKKTAGLILETYYAGETFTFDPFTGRATVETNAHGVWEGRIRPGKTSKLVNRNGHTPMLVTVEAAKANKLVIHTKRDVTAEPGTRRHAESTWTLTLK
jgi:hypothetical protein